MSNNKKYILFKSGNGLSLVDDVTVVPRWALREQTDRVSAPQTAASHELGSDHGEETSHHVHDTTVATHPLEAEDGPSGELTLGHFTFDTWGEHINLHALHSCHSLH